MASKRFNRRLYETTALVAVRKERVIVLFWTRRGRKSTTMGSIAFDEMSREAGRTVISASASLLLGTELVNMTVSAAEQAILVANEAQAVNSVFESSAAEHKLDYKCADAETGKVYGPMSRENFADLYRSKRLEMRLYHSKSDYSRQLVIAPNPATARGWRGTVLRDEAGFTSANLETALREAVDPIFRDVPDLKMIYGSNLCRDDRHPFFEMTMPPAGVELPVNPAGNFYRGQDDILIHRVTLRDAYAAGHVLYDNKGNAMTYEEFAAQASNRAQMPYNYDLEHKMGGSAAIDLLALLTSQQRGAQTCSFVYVDSDADFRRALDLLRANLGPGVVTVGFDPATTTKESSNPTGVTVAEMRGGLRKQPLVMCWKEKEPAIVRERMKLVFETIGARPAGGRAKALVVGATNERYFAKDLADHLGALVPTILVVESEGIHPAGYEKPINFKTYIGDIYCAAVNENRYDLPAGEYFKKDQRLTIKSGGRYDCPVDSTSGAHGDTFSSGGFAEYGFVCEEAGSFFAFKNPGRAAAAYADRRERSLEG
jgi:hypothetical protein